MWCVAHNLCFVIHVSISAQGSIDSDTYQSENYKSYNKCCEEYLDFSHDKHWLNLQNVLNEYITATYEY